ncbi:hypothetical protein [Pacificoceanicola onchidii]|uniref:hypothetical protein n=1 Tax=Pacificoceanicola onchidii TaxID=2562685 RepID=UPI001F0DB958|nr:hypothetical protein [Pacificoceanicola onchidii]
MNDVTRIWSCIQKPAILVKKKNRVRNSICSAARGRLPRHPCVEQPGRSDQSQTEENSDS